MAHRVTSHADYTTQLDAAGHKLVVVFFDAPWSGTCKGLTPSINEMAGEFQNDAVFLLVDIDDRSEIARTFFVKDLPYVAFVKNKESVGHLQGRHVTQTSIHDDITKHK
ncbi:Thioredoxin [Orbilia ellipsospora]|uniref:Thioredoxin n=1 Tax=Orbilia ellipsospora TaxID=2528407 RepID=A0AAV9WXU3_9PEZI